MERREVNIQGSKLIIPEYSSMRVYNVRDEINSEIKKVIYLYKGITLGVASIKGDKIIYTVQGEWERETKIPEHIPQGDELALLNWLDVYILEQTKIGG